MNMSKNSYVLSRVASVLGATLTATSLGVHAPAWADAKSVAAKASPAKASAVKAPTDLEYIADIEAWRDRVQTSLKRDNGWLTLAGRFVMKPGVNTFGTDAKNDIVFPKELVGAGPATLGTITIDPLAKTVNVKFAEGTTWKRGDKPTGAETALSTASDNRDWVSFERIAMHVISRDGKYILRLADNKSAVRENFQGRLWYAPDDRFRVQAKFVPYTKGRTIPIVNVIDEISDEPTPGYVEFTMNGVKQKLDVVGDGDGLFFVIRDGTSGDTTYRPSRFLFVEKRPEPNKPFMLDFNRAYNPPCAFSEFTTCPLPPQQNIMKFRIEAGEKYRKPA
jgi:uncharacterized protein